MRCHENEQEPYFPKREELQGSKLHVIEGVVPSLNKMERDSCRFAPRIPWIDENEHEQDNMVVHDLPIEKSVKRFPTSRKTRTRRRRTVGMPRHHWAPR